ncbi:5'-nucleotidase domain-containing protein 1 isoform X2 [Rhinoderma darwinii]|uniref:5'-nucleotidase domain-containing protein 1 isoform X2 n=1 Tax=Rhinoderma darwinii TaxID=43563 RepID=UPI003F6689CC
MSDHFSLSDCDVIGFDLDHTLCRYRLQESSKLIYDSFAQYLVAEKGYKEDLLSVTPEEWDFCSKGLVLDLEEGNFLKLAADGTILRACHGTKTMTAEMIEEVYGEKREWKHFKTINGTYARSAKYYFYDNYFDLPGALLCAKIVDSLEMIDGQKKYDFWKDVISSIEHNYKTTAFKDNDEEIDMLPALENAGWYSQGNWVHLYDLLKKMTGKLEPKVVYFGDSMRSDIFSARHYSNWETVLILEELEGGEVQEPDVTDLGSSLKKKGKYDNLPVQENYSISKKWGSYFADCIPGTKSSQDTPNVTWCCSSIRNYSTITIPSITAIVDLPLDYKFTRFSSSNTDIDGYYPQPPAILLSPSTEGAAA